MVVMVMEVVMLVVLVVLVVLANCSNTNGEGGGGTTYDALSIGAPLEMSNKHRVPGSPPAVIRALPPTETHDTTSPRRAVPVHM